MKQLRIIYHSQGSHVDAMAQAVFSGACQEEGVSSQLIMAPDAGLQDLLDADALIFGTPENFGYMSGMLKDFFDRTFYPAEPYKINLPYALFVGAGNDGTGAISAVERIVLGYPLRKVAEPVLSVGGISDTALQQCEELGLSIAAGTSMGIF
ncbi:MAG: flavodoxin family protein [Pseudomonadales bacterium]